jgi:hypothetical protein
MSEEWRAIVGYEGLYEVSDQGRVRSVDRVVHRRGSYRNRECVQRTRGRLLRPGTDDKGYRYVNLHKENKARTIFVHTLVLEAFVGPPPSPQHVCRHGDNIPGNNKSKNLCWGTQKENNNDKLKHGTLLHGEDVATAILKKADVIKIRHLVSIGHTQSSLAKAYGVIPQTINVIVKRKTWRHV